MSMIKTGKVAYYDVKQTQNGSWQHKLKIDGDNFSAFAKDEKPRANPGDEVEFQYEQKGKYFNISGQIKVVKRASGHQQPSNGAYPTGQDDNRQLSICRQSSMNYAAQVIGAMTSAGRMNDLNVDEVAAEVIRLADEYFLPYAMKGEKNYGVKDPVSDYRTEDEEDPEIPF